MASSTAPPSQNVYGHNSRQDNLSISSNTSNSGRSERGSRQNSHKPPVESAVTRLLVSIKQLLESLTHWSEQRIDENQVSNVYVRLGNDFNAAVAAFMAFNIDMGELLSVPEDLRAVLEQCLAEDATPDILEIYLPSVRAIITNLLQGLRNKQAIYRQRYRSEPRHERTESRSRTSRRDGHRSQGSRAVAEEEIPENVRPESSRAESNRMDSGSVSSRNNQSRRKHHTSQSSTLSNGDEVFVGGFATQDMGSQLANVPETKHSRQPSSRIMEQLSHNTSLEVLQEDPPNYVPPSMSNDDTIMPEPLPTPPPSVVPATMKRYSLVDKPVNSPPTVVVELSNPEVGNQANGPSKPSPPNTPPIHPPPAVANSLAALQKSDMLERRASKRFSIYNISKMTGGSTSRDRVGRHPNRRSLAVSSALTPGELAVLTEVDDEDPVNREESFKSRHSRPATPENTPPLPRLPATPVKAPESVKAKPDLNAQSSGIRTTPEPPQESSKITVFLQLGREVKKVSIEQGLSFPSLRVLFVDKFSYNPGQDNFPAIYIRDPSSGVQYELEDTDEVKEKCLLSLNIEPLDQIKQHIDTQMSGLAQDIKDLKSAVATNNRHSLHISDMVAQPLAQSTPAPNRPSDRQFQHVAKRLSRFVGDSSLGSSIPQPQMSPSTSQIFPQMTGQSLQPQMTGASVLSDYTIRVVSDLKTQFDEVQNLRRDLGVMRQLYTEFMKHTKESLGTLRTQTQSVKQLASSSVGGARGYIDSGKKNLDMRSQNVLTEIERLQDMVEGVKDDVIKRQITPKAQYFKNIKKDIETNASELQSLREHIKTVKPMWKKTWEEELQNIVEEQQFLTHQEEFLNDLLEDHKAMLEVYGHVEKVVTLRGNSVGSSRAPRNRSFRPLPPDEGHTGLSTVMLEIRGAAVDPEKRMKAIEANQKNRQKELAARTDELHSELTDFVGQKKLKMTGGAEEAERVRQKRNEQTLKAMFNGNGSTLSSMTET